MANLLEDIKCASSNTRPPMLDRTDFASWQQRIQLYYRGNEGALHLGLPKDIYTLINHYTNAKDIWDNVKMLLEGSKLTKEDPESQLFVTAVKLNRGLRDSNYDQLYAYLKQHEAHGRQNRGQGNNARGTGAACYGGAQNRVWNGTSAAGYEGALNRIGKANAGQARQIKCYNCNGGQDNAVDEDVDEQPVQDLALTTMFMANLSSAYPVYDEASP
ncbi:hypothetical protein Tco_0167245, partial [Tanacetum coccineum]